MPLWRQQAQNGDQADQQGEILEKMRRKLQLEKQLLLQKMAAQRDAALVRKPTAKVVEARILECVVAAGSRVRFACVQDLYQKRYGEKINPKYYNYPNLTSFVYSMSSIVPVDEKGGKGRRGTAITFLVPRVRQCDARFACFELHEA